MVSVNELEVKLLVFIKTFFVFACVLCYSSSVYVEGDIETRVYNDSISSEVKSIPEICIRRDGMFMFISLILIIIVSFIGFLLTSDSYMCVL